MLLEHKMFKAVGGHEAVQMQLIAYDIKSQSLDFALAYLGL